LLTEKKSKAYDKDISNATADQAYKLQVDFPYKTRRQKILCTDAYFIYNKTEHFEYFILAFLIIIIIFVYYIVVKTQLMTEWCRMSAD